MRLAPGIIEDDFEFGALQTDQLAGEILGAEPRLLALADEEIRIPGRLFGHLRGIGRGASMKGAKKRELAGPPAPVTGIIEIAFAAVHHPMPVSAEIARGVLKNPVTAIEIVKGIKEAAANESKGCGRSHRPPIGELLVGRVPDLPPKRAVKDVGGQQPAQEAIGAEHPIDRFGVSGHGSKCGSSSDAHKKIPSDGKSDALEALAMKTKAFCAILTPLLAVGGPFLWPQLVNVRSTNLSPAHLRTGAAPSASDSGAMGNDGTEVTPGELIELQTGVERGILKAEFRGNGRDVLHAKLTNLSKAELRIQTDLGQMFEAGLNTVALVRPAFTNLAPGATAQMKIQTAATRAGNKLSEQSYRLSYGRVPKVERLLIYAQDHPELSAGAIQTAVLALTENLPLSAVCKFTPIGGELKSRFNTDPFRVETADLVMALTALREIGVPDSSVVMTVDPQLKVEAMIEPLCRAAAMRYYGISEETEWDFWRHELLQGDPSTRHYALYGIARFYPDVALEMLPKWARESKTNAVFRLSAVQALADTQRPEALPLLRQLADELGLHTELGRAAVGAAEYLDLHLASVSTKQASVTFRTGSKLGKF